MVILLDDPSGIGQGIQQASSALAQALQQRGVAQQLQQQQQQEQQRLSSIDQVLQQSDPSTPEGQRDMIRSLMQRNVPVKEALSIMESFKPDPVTSFFQKAGLGTPGAQPQAPGVTVDAVLQDTKVTPEGITYTDQIMQMPDDVLLEAASSSDPRVREIGRTMRTTKDAAVKHERQKRQDFEKDREWHSKMSDKSVQKNEEDRQMVSRKSTAFKLARDAVDSGEVGAFSLSNIGRRLGVKELETARGAQLTTASKEHLIPNLSSVSAKAQNLWLEQIMSSMFAEVGKSEEANKAALIMLEGENDVAQARTEIFDRIAAEDMKENNYVRRDIDTRVAEEMKAVEADTLGKTGFKLRQNYESEKGIPWMYANYNKKVPQGTPLTPEMAKVMVQQYNGDYSQAVTNAKKLGYVLPKREEQARWQ